MCAWQSYFAILLQSYYLILRVVALRDEVVEQGVGARFLSGAEPDGTERDGDHGGGPPVKRRSPGLVWPGASWVDRDGMALE